jgi:amidohydrolase
MKTYGIDGTVQLLGTPAEELGGGKALLLQAGAYDGVDVSLMAHPCPVANDGTVRYPGGCAGLRSNAKIGISATYSGKSAHAGAEPWEGINALDALVSGYINVGLLRQQMTPDCRIHGAIVQAPKVANIIPDQTKTAYSIRASTIAAAEKLTQKVDACLRAGALATGCSCSIESGDVYADLVPNPTLCENYSSHMKSFGKDVEIISSEIMGGSTDQGNVSHVMPALHPMFGIPCRPGINIHSREFAEVAGTSDAFEMAIVVGKAMALTGWDVMTKDVIFKSAREDFGEAR